MTICLFITSGHGPANCAAADAEDQEPARNALHHLLERGPPVRRFIGPDFTPQKGTRYD